MIVDQAAANPAFPDGRLPDQDLHEVMAWARERLALDGTRPWKLISARRKLSKVLFEIEEQRGAEAVRLIAKISSDERTRVTFDALRALWDAGFRPPSQYTVVEPVAYFEERNLVILERAPGVELYDRIGEPHLVEGMAEWLVRLHAAPVPVERWKEAPGRVEKWAEELASLAPAHAGRLRELAAAARVDRDGPIVPCHGDFHLLNMFVAEDGRLTGIDVDKFGGREREEEVGYSLTQTATICFHRMGSFGASLAARELFLSTYERTSGVRLDRRRMGAHMAATLIKNLHFDLFTYKSGRLHILDSWLDAATRCLDGDLAFA